jgi:hypothetical protein
MLHELAANIKGISPQGYVGVCLILVYFALLVYIAVRRIMRGK